MDTTPFDRSNDEALARAAHAIADQLIRRDDERSERLGEIFLACHRAREAAPDAYAAAEKSGKLELFLLERVRGELTGEPNSRPNGGWLGTFVDVSAREIGDDHEDNTDAAALELSRRALRRAVARARSEKNETLLRNLHWYSERLAHRSYDSIARESGRIPATIRTGVARARKFVLRIVHELQHAQPAPLTGEAPAAVEPLRRLWFEQRLDELDAALAETREEYQNDPHWLNLAGLLAADRGRRTDAVALYERALVAADAPSVRARVLNNLGNLLDDNRCADDARVYWMRAHQLLPDAPAPLLNLLAHTSQTQDYAAAQHFLCELADRPEQRAPEPRGSPLRVEPPAGQSQVPLAARNRCLGTGAGALAARARVRGTGCPGDHIADCVPLGAQLAAGLESGQRARTAGAHADQLGRGAQGFRAGRRFDGRPQATREDPAGRRLDGIRQAPSPAARLARAFRFLSRASSFDSRGRDLPVWPHVGSDPTRAARRSLSADHERRREPLEHLVHARL